jgi:CRISPR-associated endonuclease/helicase Cas3
MLGGSGGAGAVDLNTPETYRRFFADLYGARDLDAKGIQTLRKELDFRTVAQCYRIVEDGWSAPLVVPWKGAVEAIDRLRFGGPSRESFRALQRLTVNVRADLRGEWLAQGDVEEVEGVVALVGNREAYSSRFGLLIDKVGSHAPASLIVDG